MVNLKNNTVSFKLFVLLLTLFFTYSCSTKKYYVSKIEGSEIVIDTQIQSNEEFENYIKPFRDKINNDLNQVLSVAPITLDKNGKWQSSIGNFLADITLEQTNPIFKSRENKTIDLCLLNHGGIRSIIPAGNVTTRTAYEIMPFENSSYVVGLKGEQINEMANYLIKEKKPHPISGLTFTIKDNIANNIKINNQNLDLNKIYYVVTSDYLINGGDNMTFLGKFVEKYDLDYKLRNVLIDYFKSHKEIIANTNQRITEE